MKKERIVCWRCKKGGRRGDKPLRKISDLDYACDDCLVYGKPPIENDSKIYYDLEEKMKCLQCKKEFYRWRFYRCPHCGAGH